MGMGLVLSREKTKGVNVTAGKRRVKASQNPLWDKVKIQGKHSAKEISLPGNCYVALNSPLRSRTWLLP